MSDTFNLGGESSKSFSWGMPGTVPDGRFVQGTVLDMQEVQANDYDTGKPAFWDDGKPKMQYRVSLQTELRDPEVHGDDGKRDVYLDGRRTPFENGGKSKLCAVLDAVRETTGGVQLQRGAKLTLQWSSGMGHPGDPRCFTAWYEAPALNLGAQPPGVAPAAVQAPPVAQVAPPQTVQQTIATQGPPPAFAQPAAAVAAPPVAPPVAQAPPVQQGPTPEAIAALQAAGVDPATVYPGWVAPQPVG